MSINYTRQYVLIVFVFCTLILNAQVESVLAVKDFSSFEEWLTQVNIIRLENPESAAKSFQGAYDYFIENRDTLSAVNTLVEMSINHGHQVEYQLAYDKLWKALFLADQAHNDKAKIPVFIQLGRYYSFYKREETALEYLHQALALAKSLTTKTKDGNFENELLSSCYYALCSTHRDFNNGIQANAYLDSAYQYVNQDPENSNIYYLKFEGAWIDKFNGKDQQSIDTIFSIQPWFKKNSPSFQVLLFKEVGDSYLALKDHKQAESYYKRAIDISEQYKSHLDYVPVIYQRLAKLYSEKGNYKNAFTSLEKGIHLDKIFFDSRSKNNRSLLEIKDEFRLEKEKQKQLIQEQKINNLEKEEQLNFLENLILVVVIISLLFVGFLYVKNMRRKHQVEKSLIRKKRELEVKQTNRLRELEIQQAAELRQIEVQQSNELLELKNKELATSSLKLIEKDEVLSTLKDRLSQGDGDIKAHELKKIVRSISHSNAQNWEEFEARFMSVNKEFYNKLNAKYHKLTRGDQKLCALVKLNLSSKEMAKLLGISIESVHTNRYRLRKKLNLTREVSLTEFVAKL